MYTAYVIAANLYAHIQYNATLQLLLPYITFFWCCQICHFSRVSTYCTCCSVLHFLIVCAACSKDECTKRIPLCYKHSEVAPLPTRAHLKGKTEECFMPNDRIPSGATPRGEEEGNTLVLQEHIKILGNVCRLRHSSWIAPLSNIYIYICAEARVG